MSEVRSRARIQLPLRDASGGTVTRCRNLTDRSVGTAGCVNAASHLAAFPLVKQTPLRTATAFDRTHEVRSLRDCRTARRAMVNRGTSQ
jgi:hypothetical protein